MRMKVELIHKLLSKKMLLEKAVWDYTQSKRVKGEKLKKRAISGKVL
jgi:hypothetical protein